MKDTIVLIDSGFLSKISKKFGKGRYLAYDIKKLAENLAKKQDLNCKKIFYYTAPPFQSIPSTKEENLRRKKYDKFITSLLRKNITIREGKCHMINNKYQQKGVDTLLTIDLSHVKEDFPEIKKIILISSDTDFCPIIKDIKKRNNIEVILYSYFDKKRQSKFSISNELIQCCSRFIQLTKQDFDNSPLEKEES